MTQMLVRGVIFELAVLMRSTRPVAALKEAATAETGSVGSRLSATLDPELELERRVRAEVMGMGNSMSTEQADERPVLADVASALGVRGFESASATSLDPRDVYGAASSSRKPSHESRTSPPTPQPVNLLKKASTPVFNPFVKEKAEAGSGSDIRAKYQAKLRSKTGRGFETVESLRSGKGSKLVDDAERRSAVRKLVEATEVTRGGHQGRLFPQATIDLLKYLKWRGLRLGLLPRQQEVDASSLLGDAARDLSIDAVAPPIEDEDQELRWVYGALDSEPKKLLVIAQDQDVLHAARTRGSFTCRFGAGDGSAGFDYNVVGPDEVSAVIDDLNGVSLRTRG